MNLLVDFCEGTQSNDAVVIQDNEHVILFIEGLQLPNSYKVLFGNRTLELDEYIGATYSATSKIQVPSMLLKQPYDIIGYIGVDIDTVYRFDLHMHTRNYKS